MAHTTTISQQPIAAPGTQPRNHRTACRQASRHLSWAAMAVAAIWMFGGFLLPPPMLLQAAETAPFRIRCMKGRISIQARNTPAQQVIEALSESCGIRIEGLAPPPARTVTLTMENQPVASGIRSLMRQLAIDSYALEFWDHRVRRVQIPNRLAPPSPSPKTTVAAPSTAARPEDRNVPPKATAGAVRVKRLAEGHQARSAGLQSGDLIVAFDGRPITNTRELRRSTKTKTEIDQVELTVIREGFPVVMIISGGTIGVYVEDIQLPSETMAGYLKGIGTQ